MKEHGDKHDEREQMRRMAALMKAFKSNDASSLEVCNRARDIDFDMVAALLECEPSPCGHSSQYAYSEDGGKNMVCLLCERARSSIETLSYMPGLRQAEKLLRENGFEKSAKAIQFQINVLEANPEADKPVSATACSDPDGERFRWLCDAAGRQWDELLPHQMCGRLREAIDAEMNRADETGPSK